MILFENFGTFLLWIAPPYFSESDDDERPARGNLID